MDIQEWNNTIQMHEMTPSNCEILLCTCVDLVVEKEILSVASLHLLSNLYSWQPRSHTSTTVCIVVNSFGLFSVQGLTQLSILDLCFSLCAFFCHCRSLWRTNCHVVFVMLLLFYVIEFLQLMFVIVKPQLCSSRSYPCPRPQPLTVTMATQRPTTSNSDNLL